MAFPDNVPILAKAVDPSSSADLNNIANYQSLVAQGKFSEAQEFLARMTNGVAMNLNAGRYNEAIDLINTMAEFLGTNNSNYTNYINKNINAYKDINAWNSEIDYSVGNIVIYNYIVYKCIQENGPNTIVIEPKMSENWTDYWQIFVQNQKQYPLETEEPIGLNDGDLWFELIE